MVRPATRGQRRAAVRAFSRLYSWLPPAVWLLGWISLLTDTASEAIYPLLPVFLTAVLGARPLALGVIEGVAEATSAIVKVIVGRVSDRQRRRRAWVVAGYSVSSLVRPATAVVSAWSHVLAVRFVDRIGKGIRTAPRDALLAAAAPPHARGRVYSFHRAMDHAGAVAGPLLAAGFLWAWPGRYRPLFALTLIPGIFVVVLLFRLPEDAEEEAPGSPGPLRAGSAISSPGLRAGWDVRARGSRASGETVDGPAGQGERAPGRAPDRLPDGLWRAFAVFAVFALGNSTDAYLLLRLGEVLKAASLVPLAWAALHVVKVITSLLGGAMADRYGRKISISIGWVVYAVVYALFATVGSPMMLGAAFLFYGAYFGLTEGAEKALVADLSPAHVRGTAFGWYNAVIGIGALAASVAFGLLWERLGAPVAFGTGAALALIATVLLWALVPAERARNEAMS